MEQFKIENFLKEFPQTPPPRYISLNGEACSKITHRIQKRFSLPASVDGLALVKSIDALAKPCQGIANIGDNFNLELLLEHHSIPIPKYIYINWYRYDKIDKFDFSDVNDYFYNIWYPEADDIEIFDDSLEWLFSIRHDGSIKCLIPNVK